MSLNPEHTETKRKYAAAESTYLYASPSAASAKLFSYAKGADVEVLGTVDKNWLSAIYNGNFGYVRSGHLSQAQETSYEEKPETVIKPSLAVRGGIIANMRSGPGKEFEVVAELPSGTALNQLEELGAWYKVEASGLVGYVNTSCIEFI
ncbi:MAG TPA: SH3 domain-containing protein [Clostridia bacterium]|nr:SH3 domain-containing protein [Clostridia bacterium]